MSVVYSAGRHRRTRDRRKDQLSVAMRYALALLVAQESRGYRNGEGTTTSDESDSVDGQAWIHFQTARALERRGLVELDYTLADSENGPAIWVLPRGYKVARNAVA